MEHRLGERFSVDNEVRLLTSPAESRLARLINVSFTGALIKTDCELRLWCRIEVFILAIHGSVIPAYVTRQCTGAIGVEWCEPGSQAVSDLLRRLPTKRREVAAPPKSS
jgi:hypothetical protein